MTQATRHVQDSVVAALYLAIELSKKRWKLAFLGGSGRAPRLKSIAARDLEQLQQEIELAKQRLGLPSGASVRCCYEAGRDGMWLHRYLESVGIDSLVVDPGSLKVSRRRRRAKTDRLDAQSLVAELVRHHRGEREWSVLRVPTVADEDARQLHRDRETLKSERRAHRQRIQSLVFTQGIDVTVGRHFLKRLESLRQWDGSPLPPQLKSRLIHEYERLLLVEKQIRALESERQELLAAEGTPAIEKAKLMARLRGIGEHSGWVLAMEYFGWRCFSNRKQVGAAAGLTGTPYDSGGSTQDQGISKAGNARVRSLMVELGWCWLRYQPDSKLSKWFVARFGGGGARMRRIGIVALARRLLIELWRLVELGVVPEGARLKPCKR